MPVPVPMSKRIKIAAALASGEGVGAIAARLGVSKTTVKRFAEVLTSGGSLEPKQSQTGPAPSLGAPERAIVERLCREDPQVPVETLAERLSAAMGRGVAVPTLRRFMGRWGIRRVRPASTCLPEASVDGSSQSPSKVYGYGEQHRRDDDPRRYPSSLTDAEWELIGDIFENASGAGRPEIYPRRSMVDAAIYVVRSGCSWRMLPKDFPPWNHVYVTFRRWSAEGRFVEMQHRLRDMWLEREGLPTQPTEALIDSQTVQTSENGGPKGYDSGKKRRGRKRHLVTNTIGLLLAVSIQTADIQDRDGADDVFAKAMSEHPTLATLYADAGYAGRCAKHLQHTHGVDVRVMRRADDRNGRWETRQAELPFEQARAFKPIPKLWVVERTHAWNVRPRRLTKDFDRLPEVTESWVWFAQARLLANRLTALSPA